MLKISSVFFLLKNCRHFSPDRVKWDSESFLVKNIENRYAAYSPFNRRTRNSLRGIKWQKTLLWISIFKSDVSLTKRTILGATAKKERAWVSEMSYKSKWEKPHWMLCPSRPPQKITLTTHPTQSFSRNFLRDFCHPRKKKNELEKRQKYWRGSVYGCTRAEDNKIV